jgi:hypothetical protein
MTLRPQQQTPAGLIEVMHVSLVPASLCVWLVCNLAGVSAFAADVTAASGAAGVATQTTQKQPGASAAVNATADITGRQDPIKLGAPPHYASKMQHSRVRAVPQTASVRDGRGPLSRSRGAQAGGVETTVLASTRTAIAGERSILWPGAAHVLISTGRRTATTQGVSAMIASSAAGPVSKLAAPVNPPVTSLKALSGNGVIGGPRAADRSMLGGAANRRLTPKSGIDGGLLRRRF